MNREERIEKARQLAAERAPKKPAKSQQRAGRVSQRLAEVGAAQAQRHVAAEERSGTAKYLSSLEAPQEWEQATELARQVTIGRAKRRDTITDGEIRWVIFNEFRKLLDHPTFADLVKSVDHETDGVLLSSIIVTHEDGKPSDGFMFYARDKGFDHPLETLQRQVYSQFS